MAKEKKTESGGTFFPAPQREQFPTGATLYDLCINGYAEAQIISVFGKSGTGKSQILLEAAANFIRKYDGNCIVRYHDSENARAPDYAANFVPLDSVCFTYTDPEDPDDPQPRTVEDFEREVVYYTDPETRPGCPVLIIMDSWDALSCEAELEREIGETSTFKMDKAKIGKEFARKMTAPMGAAGVTLLLASQSTMTVGGPFSYETRSGGSWLQFFPTQVVRVKQGEAVSNTRNGYKRAYGNWIEIIPVKNRRQAPRPSVELFMMYGYGLCDLMSCAKFVITEGQARRLWDPKPDDAKKLAKMKSGAPKTKATEVAAAKVGKEYLQNAWQFNQDEYAEELARVRQTAIDIWKEIDEVFAPRRKKYGQT